MLGQLPYELKIGDKMYPINTDFRIALIIFQAFNDSELDDRERILVTLNCLFEDPQSIPNGLLEEAYTEAVRYLDGGDIPKKNHHAKVMDWEQDERLIFSAVNKVYKEEVRSTYMHWWTFLGYLQESGETLLSTVIHIRNKRAHRKKLDKAEERFLNENRDLIIIKRKLTQEESEQKAHINRLFGRSKQKK